MKERNTCRICGSKDIIKFLSLGNMPLAGGFLKKEDIPNEKKYPLDIYFCKNCSLVQVLDVIPPDILFKDYRYLSSSTKTLSEHFKKAATYYKERFLRNKTSFVVEIGSNDGVLLKPLTDLGINAIGIDPSENVSKIAKSKGLKVIVDYFTKKVAKEIVNKYGKADLIIANNVFAHIDNLDEVMDGIKILLKEDGVYIFEVQYIIDLLENTKYDTMYHEHLCYYSLHALSYLMDRFGIEIFDVERIPIHSGSIRVFVRNKGKNESISKKVKELLELENRVGILDEKSYIAFGDLINKNKIELVGLLKNLKKQGKRIIGYGAPGSSIILLNYCDIGKEILDYVVDVSLERYGRVIPGKHIEILHPDKMKEKYPDYALILAYTYKDEILSKEKDFIEKGGKFIMPLPKIEILP